MIDVLRIINLEMEKLRVNYSYGENMQNPPEYPYWVGSYTLTDGADEDGEMNPTVILTGFFRGLTAFEAETEISKITDHFKSGRTCIINGKAVAVYFQNCIFIPQDMDGLRKSEIYLSIKYWKGK